MTDRTRGRWALLATAASMVLFALHGWSGLTVALCGLIVFLAVDGFLEVAVGKKGS